MFKGLSKLILSSPASKIVGGTNITSSMETLHDDDYMHLMEQGDVIIGEGAT